jgi:hypothetical protein
MDLKLVQPMVRMLEFELGNRSEKMWVIPTGKWGRELEELRVIEME